MGCSDSKELLVNEPWTGKDLRKEEYKGIMSRATAENVKMTNMFAKFFEWRGKSFISRSDYKGYRQ